MSFLNSVMSTTQNAFNNNYAHIVKISAYLIKFLSYRYEVKFGVIVFLQLDKGRGHCANKYRPKGGFIGPSWSWFHRPGMYINQNTHINKYFLLLTK